MLARPLVASLLTLLGLTLAPIVADPTPLRGFSTVSGGIERGWEAKFKSIPDPSRMRESMRVLSLHPHHVGSPYDKQNAEWIRDQFRAYGWQTEIETFDVLFPTPIARMVELVSPTKFRATLQEAPLSEDPTSSQRAEQLPAIEPYTLDTINRRSDATNAGVKHRPISGSPQLFNMTQGVAGLARTRQAGMKIAGSVSDRHLPDNHFLERAAGHTLHDKAHNNSGRNDVDASTDLEHTNDLERHSRHCTKLI